jgi:hypothetical protein
MSFRNPVRLLWVVGFVTEFVFRAWLVLVALAWRMWWQRATEHNQVIWLIHREMSKWRDKQCNAQRLGRHQAAQFWGLMIEAFQMMLSHDQARYR